MQKHRTLLLAALLGSTAATAQTHMQQSAAAAYQQQQFQQQQLMLHIQDNISRCGDPHGHGCQTPQATGGGRPLQWRMTGLSDSYGGLMVEYVDDLVTDNYGKPLPFSWEAYDYGHGFGDKSSLEELDMEKDLDPVGGYYIPYKLISIGRFRWEPYTSAEGVARAVPENCGGKSCVLASVYRNTCNAYAAGWLKDFSGVRIYTARSVHYGDTAYGDGSYYNIDPEDWTTAVKMVEASIADALQRCQSDPAVNPRTCAAPPARTEGGRFNQHHYCALPTKTGARY